MGYNLPTYDTTKLSFGMGILKIAALNTAGNTTAIITDVGAVKEGATLTITRTKLKAKQGNPQQIIKEFVTEESVVLNVAGMEWNLPNLAKALGGGAVTGTTSLKLGGDMDMSSVAVLFQHRTPAGDTIHIRLWKANGSGEMSTTFGNDLHNFPYSFEAIVGASDWSGSALADKEKLMQIYIEQA